MIITKSTTIKNNFNGWAKRIMNWWMRFNELEDNLQNSITIKTKQQNKNKKNSNDLWDNIELSKVQVIRTIEVGEKRFRSRKEYFIFKKHV